ncbi:MAG: B12-binding domain-containing radical SAM protein, partial [Desulfosudaceae bacterium]
MKQQTPGTLKGVAFLEKGALVRGGREEFIRDLDSLPRPDYTLIDLNRYTDHGYTMNGVLAEKKHVHIISSRGCPYGCLYCHDIFGKKFRPRSPESFVGEIKWLYYQHGVREFHIVDDIFNLDKKRLREILNRIISSDLKIKIAFPNGIRGDLLDETDIRLLRQAGCYMITFAIETASRRLQKVIKKNLEIDKAMANIELASRAGIITRSFFMLGFPGETVAEIKSTISLAVNSPLDLVFFFSVVPFKNTGLERLAAREYPRLNSQDSHYWGQIPFYQQATGYPLKRTQILAYLKFYLPFRIWRTFRKLPHKRRIAASWLNMALFIVFTRWYENFQNRGQRRPL